MSGLKFSSRTDSLEFREILLDSTALCFVLMCLFMFLTALNNWPHSGHFTFAWSCWCFSCWWLFKKDLGFSLHPPAMHIHTPSLAEALCILLTWSFMYAFELVLYLQSSQEKYCSSSSNLCLRACWTSLSLLWNIFPHSTHLICFPIFCMCTVILCLLNEVTAMSPTREWGCIKLITRLDLWLPSRIWGDGDA